MSISLNLAGLPCSSSSSSSSCSSSHLDNNKSFFLLRASGLSFQFRSLKPKISSLNHSQFRRFFSVNGDHIDVHGFSDAKSCSPQDEDPVEKSAGGQAPGKMGYLAAVERFLKIMAMVWAGSQVTKIARAGGAVALAPFVDRGLSCFTVKYKFESQGKAFMAIVSFCLGLAILLFFFVTLLWA